MDGNRALFDATDWAATPLGPVTTWPAAMRAVVDMALASGFPVCTAWGDHEIQIYNSAYNAIYGDKHPAAFARPTSESWPEIREFLEGALAEVRSSGEPLAFRDALLPLVKHTDPEECWFDFSYSRVCDDGGRTLGLVSIAVEKTRDVVLARRHASCDLPLDTVAQGGLEALARELSATLADNPMDAAAAVLQACDPNTGTPGAVLMQLGDWPELALATPAAPTERGVTAVATPEAGRPGHVGTQAARIPLMDPAGHRVGVLVLAPHALVVPQGHLQFAGMLSDRLQRILAHADTVGAYRQRIADQDLLYRFLFDNILDAVLYARTDGRADSSETIVAANPGACRLFGYEAGELTGMTRDALTFDGDATFRRALVRREHEGTYIGELTFRRKDGSPVQAEVSSRLVCTRDGSTHSVNILRDTSARSREEAERARQARFEAIAQLTSGMAHDFNNLLTVVQGSLELLLEDLPTDSRQHDYAANALMCTERGAALTGQLLTYSRRQLLNLQPESLNARVKELLPLVRATVGERITLELVLDPELPTCRTDIALLTTAVLNLAANARDAMPDGGRLTLQTARDPAAPDSVVLRACDTGQGIPADIIDRVFEPYFTTKALGAGLGLAMVHGFVHQSGGTLRVASTPGQGTCIALYLPVSQETAPPPAVPTLRRSGDGRHLLLVDDNALIRDQTRELLERGGYRVTVAADGAIALAALHEDPPALLITDLDLPGREDGPALAQDARARCPGLPILFITGHAPGADMGFAPDDRVATLTKPFSRAALLDALAHLLGGPAS